MNDKISIILPVYNVANYLNKCMDSILNQTYSNYELIIIDDGSTDNSGKICDEYKLKDNRIQVIHQKNLGLSAARNKGINLSTGKYITFIDSDDFVDNQYIEILYKTILDNKADISICDKNYYSKNKRNISKIIKDYKFEIISKEETYKRMFLKKGIGFAVWAKLYKTGILKQNKFTEGKLYEDIFIINSLIESANKIVVTNYNGYYYLKRTESITSKKFSKKNMDLIEGSKIFKDFMFLNYPNLDKYTIRGYINANYAIYNKAILDKNYKKEYCSIRKEILSYKKEIFTNNIYSKSMKLQTFLLLFGNGIYRLFYKIYKKGC